MNEYQKYRHYEFEHVSGRVFHVFQVWNAVSAFLEGHEDLVSGHMCCGVAPGGMGMYHFNFAWKDRVASRSSLILGAWIPMIMAIVANGHAPT